MKHAFVICAAFVIFTAVAFKTPAQQNLTKVHLEGFVYDTGRNPIAGIDVAAWVFGKKGSVGGGATDASGKYSFDIQVQDRFDVSYSKSDYRSSVVRYLAEQKPQQISKILFRKGQKMPPSAAHAYLQSINRITFLAIGLPASDRRGFVERFDDAKQLLSTTKELAFVPGWVEAGNQTALSELLSEELVQIEKNLRRVVDR